ncbi:MAG TPA: alkaline phosphatase family protein [Thermoplasmata archaeon]|nr:alkaline phosphatase family protein [Thermoplasmata archaeon]
MPTEVLPERWVRLHSRGFTALAALALGLLVVAVGAGTGVPGIPSIHPAPERSPLRPVSAWPPAFPTPIRHVFVVMLENAARSTVVASGPFEDYLAQKYASAGKFYATCHPSAPNYLAITSGAPWQCGSDAYTTYRTENLGDLAQRAGLSWAGFEESMPIPCDTNNTYPYAVKHNPLVYYADVVGNTSECRAHDVPFTNWTADVTSGAIPNFALFTPNLTDDGHDTNVTFADRWLHGWLTPLVNDSFFQSSVFFIVYDESASSDGSGFNGTSGGHVYLSAVSPFARAGYNLTSSVGDYDLLTTCEWLLGLGSTGQNDSWNAWPPMRSLFSFTNTTSPLTLVAAANPSSGTVPLTVELTTSASGGSPPYSYSWKFANGTTLLGGNQSYTFSTPGNYTLTATVADSANGSARVSVGVRAYAPLAVLGLNATPTSVRTGQNVTLSTSLSGGVPPLNFRYGGLPPGCASTNAPQVRCAPSWGGSYPINVTVTDSVGRVGYANGSLVVSGGLSVGLLPVSVATDAGRAVHFYGTTAGSSGPVTWRWTGLPSGCGSVDSLALNCTPTRAGLSQVRLWANDTAGGTGRSGASLLEVYPSLAISVVPSAHRGSLPFSVRFVANASGGATPYRFNWSIDGTPVGLGPWLNWTFESYGHDRVQVDVQDGTGGLAGANTTVTVLAPIAGAVEFQPSSVEVGASTVVRLGVGGGDAPYRVAWSLNGSPFGVGNVTNFTFVPRVAGSYLFTAAVTDMANDSTMVSASLVVSPGVGATHGLTGALLVWVTGVLAVVAAGLTVLLWRRRRKEVQAPTSAVTRTAEDSQR